MSFPRYPQYKDSGVEWLGEVPDSWDVRRLSPLSTKITNGYVGPTRDIFVDDGVRYIQSLHIKANTIRFDSPYFVSKAWSDAHAKSILNAGDVLIVQTGDIGQVAVVTDEFAGCNCHALIIVSPHTEAVIGEWMSWVLNSHYGFHSLLSLQTGALHPHLNCGNVKDVAIPLPPKCEQSAIIDFLAQETTRIYGLIDEQQRLIELLQEKRQAVISHAVTKGLNPDVPMKASGVEWLGDVPEHWTVCSVGQRYEVRVGKMLDSAKITGEHLRPYLRVADVQWGTINTDDLPEMDFDDEARVKFRLRDGDLLVNEGGSYVGRAAIWRGQLEECYYQKALHRLRPIDAERDDSEFFYFVMFYATQYGVFVAGGNHNTIEHLPAEALRKYRFAFPPRAEQLSIARELARETNAIDALVAEAKRVIELLQERRTALISAAVTGKIDVRGVARKALA